MPNGLTSAQLADLAGGELVGRPDVRITRVASLEEATSDSLSFLDSPRYLSYFQRSSAGAVLVGPGFRDVTSGPATRIVVPDPYQALRRVLPLLYPETAPAWGVHPSARVGRGTRWVGRIAMGPGAILGRQVAVGRDCRIGAQAVIEDGVALGDGCVVEPHAVIHAGATLGQRVTVRPGARVGGPGFAFATGPRGHERMRHVGRCVIGDDVEIGANATVDRGSVGDTVIGEGTKIDNLVQLAHNVRVGRRCLILAQAGVAGSTVIEDDVVVAGQAGLAGHLTVGRGARVAAQAGVIGDVPAGAAVSGYPARSHREVLRQAGALRRLTPLVSRLEELTTDHARSH